MLNINGQPRECVKVMFEDMAGDQLEVVIGQQDFTIDFTKTHRLDLLAVIEAMNQFDP